MTELMRVALALAVGVTLTGCAHSERTVTPEAPKTVTRDQLLTARAKVVELERETRLVTLEGEQGRILQFRAGPDVKNLDQVSVGDEVTVQYYESILMRVLDPSEAAVNHSSAVGARAQAGEMPAGSLRQEVTFTVTVLSKDTVAGTVTFSLESGEVRTVRAADPKNLDLVKPNDRVAVTYTEAIAMQVEKASP